MFQCITAYQLFKNVIEIYNFQVHILIQQRPTLSLASLYGYLPKCDRYSLDVKQSASEFKSILQIGCYITYKETKDNLLSSEPVNNKEPKSNMENMKNVNQAPNLSEQWCLVTVRQYKRESFLKYLNNDIEKKQLQNLILEIIALEESVYDNMILLRISNYSEARNNLQQIDHFQSIQRLKPNELNRMLNR